MPRASTFSAAPGFEEAARWVRWHHEREDGTGYPDRLRGEWIPLEAKILATAAVYASLVRDDPSRPGSSPWRPGANWPAARGATSTSGW